MRWVFFSLLILNVVYLVFSLVMRAAPAPQRVMAPSVTGAAEKLVLLEESSLSVGSGSRGGYGMPPLCPVVGPWDQLAAADQASRALAESGYRAAVEPLKVARDRLHWVHLPAIGDRDQALRVLRELQSRGVDSFIVADGEDANAISLGYFSSADSARGLMMKMQTAGYPAEIRQTAKEVTEYWLRIDAGSIRDEGAALRGLLAGNPAISGNHVACAVSSPAPEPRVEENLPADQ
ncbi:MAG: SPOR domain-containing protein [Alcanivoracaceae bacterium]|jgi:hypothetical protein|nr:SPOR domain-containing protein [Alcanivoracaceae bacterium]